MTATVANNAITLQLQITFESSSINSDTITQLCDALKGRLQTVSNQKFQQCVLSSGNDDNNNYAPGNHATLQLQSEPLNDVNDMVTPITGGSTGLTYSIILIGFSYILQFLFKNM